ncbi:tat pathway signal sequence [Diplocarpon rosae]|nr:tat pathway signal sequence [Diplocarpon rosae]
MASSKEIPPHSSRHIGTNRLSTSTTSGSLPKSHARNHSSSASSGSLIANHRVSRRKSVSSNTASNVAAMVAAAREAGDITLGMPITGRRNMSKSASARSVAHGSLPSPPASLPGHRYNKVAANGKLDRGESAIDDDQNDVKEEDDEKGPKQSRIRRASEGQYRTKDGKKAHGSDLKCEKCGKGYKHSSCLSKHLWEHTPEWSLTSKLLISKHQQVQLLEAASVLVAMNQEGATPPDSAKDFQSDQESPSPAASGSSELHDGTSSADTTPPPQGDMVNVYGSGSYTGRHKRYSSGHSFSRSYQSAAGVNRLSGGSIPSGSTFGYYRQQSQERRPLSSGIGRNQEDDALAAAVELLSCSFGSTGTPRSFPVTLPEDAPPVPDIPERYLSQFSGTTLTPSHHPRQTESYTRHQVHNDGDIKMEDSEESLADDEEYDRGCRGRSDEDDDGVFGRMEE